MLQESELRGVLRSSHLKNFLNTMRWRLTVTGDRRGSSESHDDADFKLHQAAPQRPADETLDMLQLSSMALQHDRP